jgi:riboflavin biosynthesis pyrimidine reductase
MSVDEHLDWARSRVTRTLGLGGEERLVAVLVSSLDGFVALDGRSRALSSDQDRALVGAWREAADALLVGPPTLAAEVYGGGLFPPHARARRTAVGASPLPPIITVDRSGSLDVDLALRAREPLELIAYVPSGGPTADRPAADHTAADQTAADHTAADHTAADHTAADHTAADHTAADHTAADHAHADPRVRWVEREDLSLAGVIRDIRERFGHRLIVAEPGPKLLAALREAWQLTDLSLTVAPVFADHGRRLEGATGSQPLTAVDVETVGEVIFVHLLADRH